MQAGKAEFSQWQVMKQQGHKINPCNSKLHPAAKAGIPPEADSELSVQEAYNPSSACFGCGARRRLGGPRRGGQAVVNRDFLFRCLDMAVESLVQQCFQALYGRAALTAGRSSPIAHPPPPPQLLLTAAQPSRCPPFPQETRTLTA